METKVNILHIIQARTRSSRLPEKIFKKIGNKTLLDHHVERTKNDLMRQVVSMPKYDIGSIHPYIYPDCDIDWPECDENDVLSRFYLTAKDYNPEWVVRTTADCPFIDREWFLKTVKMAVENDMPIFNTFKEGSCTEVFKFEHLQRAFYEATDPYDREHVTSYFRKGFEKGSIDTLQEYIKAKELYEGKWELYESK